MAILIREKANVRVVSQETKDKISANRTYSDLSLSVIGKDDNLRPTYSVSTTIVDKHNLENYGFLSIYDDGKDATGEVVGEKKVYLGLVESKDANILKGRASKTGELVSKGRTFTSNVLQDDMADAGLIPAGELEKGVKVKFDLVEQPNTDAIGNMEQVMKLFQVVVEVVAKEDEDAPAEEKVVGKVGRPKKETAEVVADEWA